MSSRRNYEFDSVLEMAGDMDHIQLILSDPNSEEALVLGKKHRKMDANEHFLGEDSTKANA